MKDQKLIYAMRGIDDELICEAMKRRNVSSEQDGEEPETVYVTGVRTRRLWKYPVTAAAVLAVAGGALFVINYNGGIPDNFGVATGEETVGSAEETDNGEASAADDTDTVSMETQPAVSEAVEAVVPYKEINFYGCYNLHEFDFPTALYVDSYPEIPQPELDKKYFTEMSTAELLDYYGFANNFEYLMDNDVMIEVVNESTPHGIYTFPDGSVYDINTFTFELTKTVVHSANRFHVTVGKKTKFGQEYCEYYKLIGPKYKIALCGSSSFYNEEKDMLFTVFDYIGATVMFSATPDEITKNNFAGDLESKDEYLRFDKKGLIPYYFGMFSNTHVNCLNDHNNNIYFSFNYRLWYNKEKDEYFNEETGEWISAEEWVFD